ncbi:TonB-dependent receptor domain-containing protein [Rheinheimera sp. MMS21-TC3]|uniref:TonB-dependent receptor domain-containing protein n=1 Tax=Rheinheimera sp. MMS21-TC3 TaxID=3072790 RepID=UPI0028C3B4DB|nr:TonB-dependent receptor [Rheinheimera sp. MMS21-TC3]WNO62300.1 TonB-dependent receptor [Rheinheimera sp. MMS21-TC3]
MTLGYIDHDNSIYGYKIVPSEDLSPEKSDAYELGIRGQLDDFIFSAAIYYNQYDQFLSTALIDIESISNPYTGEESQVLVYQYQNIDAVTTKGIEASVRYHVNDAWSFFANAAYQDGKNDETGDYITSIAPLSGVTGLSFELENFSSELIVNWAKRMDKVNPDNIEIAGYGSLDLIASYEFTDNFRMNLSATNLTDKKYVRYLNGAGHADRSSLNKITEPSRTISANMHYSF